MIRATWPAPSNVHAFCTTRQGLSNRLAASNNSALASIQSGYDHNNLALHVGDDAKIVSENRAELARQLDKDERSFKWLNQVHGKEVVDLQNYPAQTSTPPTADASYTNMVGPVCVIMTADCLPILLCNKSGTEVAAIHAGWRSLAAGVIDATVKRFQQPDNVIAWLGPAISLDNFEVGDEVKKEFEKQGFSTTQTFKPSINSGPAKDETDQEEKWMADLYGLATERLLDLGVTDISGAGFCTFRESDRFYSYRRDGAQSGRMASIIYLS